MSEELILNINKLTFSYSTGQTVLKELSLSMEKGEKVALVGGNGAGKSTLLSILAGVHLPKSGSVRICGMDLESKNLAALRKQIGYIFQDPDDQLFMPTVLEDILFGLKDIALSKQEKKARAEAMMERLQIAHLADKAPYHLSGGEKRNAALAGVLVMEPKLLIMDEPTAFLDPRAKRVLAAELNKLPTSMFIASHDQAFISAVCPRTLLLAEGSIVADGNTQDILHDQALLEQAGL